MQVLSGASFGLTSFLSRGELPEVTGVALVALYVKVGCAVAGFVLATFFLFAAPERREQTQRWMWPCLLCIGATALCGAAFLRWFG